MAAFGFLVPYILITLAAPAYLAKLSQRRPLDMAICVASLALLVIPTVGSVYPVPAPPVTYFPYTFLGYLVIGIAWILRVRRTRPDAFDQIQEDLDTAHARYQAA
jgi:amino acid transporter